MSVFKKKKIKIMLNINKNLVFNWSFVDDA